MQEKSVLMAGVPHSAHYWNKTQKALDLKKAKVIGLEEYPHIIDLVDRAPEDIGQRASGFANIIATRIGIERTDWLINLTRKVMEYRTDSLEDVRYDAGLQIRNLTEKQRVLLSEFLDTVHSWEWSFKIIDHCKKNNIEFKSIIGEKYRAYGEEIERTGNYENDKKLAAEKEMASNIKAQRIDLAFVGTNHTKSVFTLLEKSGKVTPLFFHKGKILDSLPKTRRRLAYEKFRSGLKRIKSTFGRKRK